MMSIRKSVKSGLAIAVVGSLALTACGSDGGGSGDGKVTLQFTWWGADERADRYRAAVALFEEANPDITVKTSFAEFPDYWTQRSTDATSGELPDVLQMDASRLMEYANNGLLYDMNEFVGDQLDTSQIDENLLSTGEADEQLLAMPTGTNTLSLIYNPDVLDELGVEAPDWDYTWEDYHAFHTEVSEAGADLSPQIYGSTDYTTIWWMFMQHLVQQGVEPFAESGEMNFDEDDMRDWLNSAEDLREPVDLTFPAERTDQLAPLGGFTRAEAAAEFTWDNYMQTYSNDLDSENLQLLPVPTGEDGEKHMFAKPTMQLSIGANTAHPEEAAMLVDFLINDPEAGQIIGTDLGVPASEGRLDALEVEEGGLDERVIEYERRVEEEGHLSEPSPTQPDGFGSVENEFVEVLGNEFGYRQLTVDEFVDRWFTEAESLLVTW